jgi:tRNA U34 2-thiouridine synthase MnmA/TrmU
MVFQSTCTPHQPQVIEVESCCVIVTGIERNIVSCFILSHVQVCEALGVPLVVVPLTQEYWQRVVSHSVAEIKAGRTPNPDMLCNSRCGMLHSITWQRFGLLS